MQCTVNSIGRVDYRNGSPVVVIEEQYREGLKGLEGFSHILLVWWAHLYAEEDYRRVCKMDAPYKGGPEKIGVFATRSPVRPNPIAVSTVQVLSIDHERGEIRIPYIDAEADTPVLDLKPYHPSEDRVKDIGVPEWCSDWPKWLEDSAEFDWGKVFNF